jgi:hypothetical protein
MITTAPKLLTFPAADLPTPISPDARRFRRLWSTWQHHYIQARLPYEDRVGQNDITGPASSYHHRQLARQALRELRRLGYYDR